MDIAVCLDFFAITHRSSALFSQFIVDMAVKMGAEKLGVIWQFRISWGQTNTFTFKMTSGMTCNSNANSLQLVVDKTMKKCEDGSILGNIQDIIKKSLRKNRLWFDLLVALTWIKTVVYTSLSSEGWTVHICECRHFGHHRGARVKFVDNICAFYGTFFIRRQKKVTNETKIIIMQLRTSLSASYYWTYLCTLLYTLMYAIRR